MQEFRTAQRIEEELDWLGIPHTRVGETGVFRHAARRKGEGGRAVVLRADIDALPIEETHECAYCSQNPGVMHACGHDAHAACLLGGAKILAEHRDAFGGRGAAGVSAGRGDRAGRKAVHRGGRAGRRGARVRSAYRARSEIRHGRPQAGSEQRCRRPFPS